MKKVFVAIILIVALLLNFSACQKQTEQNPADETNVTTTAEQTTTKGVTTTIKAETTTAPVSTEPDNPFAEKMEISWLVGTYSSHLYEEGRWDELELEEIFNVNLKMWNILVDSKNMEQVQMMLAAGDVPDYGFYYTSGKYLYDNGLGRTIPLEMIKKYYPSYYKLMVEDPIGFKVNLVEGTEDEYYGLAMYSPVHRHSGWVAMWRLDWLEALGYEMDNLVGMVSVIKPDKWNDRLYYSTTKFSIDEVKELLRAFTEDDPDGNGVDDTYGSPFANSAYDRYISYNMFGFDTNGNHFYKDPVTNDYVPYYAYTPYKESLIYLQEMLDKGYLRWVPGEKAYNLELRDIWNTAKTGFINTLGPPRVLGLGYGDGEQWPPAYILDNVDPDATFVLTPVPGAGKFIPYTPFPWRSDSYVVGNVTDEKMARIFQLIEYAYFGENWPRYKWGIEGVHYTWYAEPYKSPIVFTAADKIPPKYAGKGTDMFGQFGNLDFISDLNTYYSYDAHALQYMEYWDTYGGGWNNPDLWIAPDKFFDPLTMPADKYEEFRDLRDQTNSQIAAVHNDFLKRVWSGQIVNIDSEWEQYIDQIYAAGLSDWAEFWSSDEIKTFDYYSSIK